MKSLRFLDRRAGYSLASLGMLLGIASPAVIPAFASAAQVTSRSIELSNSAAGATNVGYTVKFTTVAAAGAFVLDFCKDSPIYGQTCVAPDDLDVTGVTTATSGFTATKLSNSLIKVASSPDMGAATAQTVVLTGIASNPSTAGDPFYARIVTFDTSANASSYSSTGTNTGKEDDGGVAMSITDSIGVTAAVRESMTFCVSGATLTSGCGGAAAANLTLGHSTGGQPLALDTSATDTANAYTQLSTNASGGATVRMTNNNTCGGLKRVGAAGCDIAPANTPDAIDPGVSALFGVKLGTPSGTGTITPASEYSDNSKYAMTYVSNGTSGVTSTYGDPIYSSTGPTSDAGVQLTFGATVSGTTPAGIYSATLNLVATGTY